MKKVLVLLSTYNGEKYLCEQIDSLLNQKEVDIQILARDDGSSDGTIKILEDYRKQGLLQWYTNGHKNVQNSFLDLCKHANPADFYAFCDQDDVWDEDKLIIAVKALDQKAKNIPLLYYCGQRLVDENLNLLSIHKVSNSRSPHTNFLISNVAGCTMVFNRFLLEMVNKYEPCFVLMHDSWVFKVCLAVGGDFVVDPEAHISYRQHRNNVVGLRGGILSKFRQVERYINTFKIQKQVQCLYDNYANDMIPEYKLLSVTICNYNKSFSNWIHFLFNREFDFKNLSLNVLVRLKILIRRL